MTVTIKEKYTVKEAVDYLKSEGYQLEKDKLYTAAKAGHLKKTGRTIALAELISYAKRHLDRTASSSSAMADEKQRLELEDLRGKVEERKNKNRKEDRRWILREEAETSTAEKILLIYNGVITRVQLDKEKIMHAVGAVSSRSAELVLAIQASVDHAFNDLANGDRFELSVTGEDSNEED